MSWSWDVVWGFVDLSLRHLSEAAQQDNLNNPLLNNMNANVSIESAKTTIPLLKLEDLFVMLLVRSMIVIKSKTTVLL